MSQPDAPPMERLSQRPAKPRGRRAPLALWLPAVVVGLGMLVPFVYLVLRAGEADLSKLGALVLRPRTFWLLGNTLSLAVGVALLTSLIALPLAWLVTRSDLGWRKLVTVLAVMPLAIPGYVMAFALIGLSGYYGFANQFFGLSLPRLEGLSGAVLALSLYTFPYLFLNLRSAFLGLDPGLEESARSFGRSRWNSFFTVTMPHLMPALCSGWLVIGLYTLGDFGTVSLMRFEVFSNAIYNQYANAFERFYAAWLALMLMVLTFSVLAAEGFFNRRRFLARTGTGTARRFQSVPLGRYRALAWGFITLVVTASLIIPAMVIVFWMLRLPEGFELPRLWLAAFHSAAIAAPSALLGVILALPVALLAARYPSKLASLAERLLYFGYAVPPVPFALAMVFFALTMVPMLYQTFPLLIVAYALSFAALALGPLRSALLQINLRQEEAARSFGYGALASFIRVTLPLIRRSAFSGGLLIFLVVAKELPLMLLLAPTGFATLATNIFHRTEEGMLVDAAPHALMLVLFCGLFVALTVKLESTRQ